jgi:hypothetical protein
MTFEAFQHMRKHGSSDLDGSQQIHPHLGFEILLRVLAFQPV